MTNKNILKISIEKACDNGYKLTQASNDFLMNMLIRNDPKVESTLDYIIKERMYYHIIFDHDFVKHFFNCDHKCNPYKSGSFYDTCKKCGEIRPIGSKWDNHQDHLQNMIIIPNPLKYLEKFV